MNDGKIKSHTQKKLTSLQPKKSKKKKKNNNLELTMVKFRLSKNKIHMSKIHIFHLLTVIQSVRVKRFMETSCSIQN